MDKLKFKPKESIMLKEEVNLTPGSVKIVKCICDYCGKEFERKYRSLLSSRKFTPKDSCGDKECRMQKREDTSLVKYGTKIPSQSSKVREKASETKGGSGISVTDYKEQILELYNSDPNISVVYIADKLGLGRTALRNYMDKELGLDITGNWEAKKNRTMLEKYGVKHILQCQIGQDKIKQAHKDKHGVENLYDDPELKEKILAKSRATSMQKYGYEYAVQAPDKQEEFQKKRRETRIKNGNEVLYDGKTAKELAAQIGINLSSFHERVRKLGIEVAVKTTKFATYLEEIMKQFLDSIDIKYQREYYVDGKIADFYIPSHKVVIECDGLYWHSDDIIKDNNYHVNKRKLYLEHGYTPLFFREDDINQKFDIVKSIISNRLGRATKLNARSCTIEEIDNAQSKQFLTANHLMGNGKGPSYGLLHNGRLVCLMRVCPTSAHHYDISRFCSALNCSVRGGFSKLLKYATQKLQPHSISTFIDLRYGNGNYLPKLGFEYVSEYPSFKWTNGRDTFHRMTFPSQTGYEQGLVKIWDCGQAKYRLLVYNTMT